ncbi:MAG: hypothetical protein LBM69_04055, partial [Lachnospiraceae bacterium]|nr:hypothetical protein [Lachnospiraceae bacterium]
MADYKNLPKMSQEQLNAICDVLAHTNEGLTKTELTMKLGQCAIPKVDDGDHINGITYQIGLNKREWLYRCLVSEVNKSQSMEKIYAFVESALNPVNYTTEGKRTQYTHLLEETNKILLLIGLQVQGNGKIQRASKAETLDEVDRRVNSIQSKL